MFLRHSVLFREQSFCQASLAELKNSKCAPPSRYHCQHSTLTDVTSPLIFPT